MKTKKAAEFKKNDRVQIRPDVLKERGYAPSDEVGTIVEGPYNNPKCGPNTYSVQWAKGNRTMLSDASELEAAPAPKRTYMNVPIALIAAAPDLLAAAKRIIRDTPEPKESEQVDLYNWQSLRSAIAKAEGR